MIWFLQMAQLSTTISQAHRATAFHCWALLHSNQRSYFRQALPNLRFHLFDDESRIVFAAGCTFALSDGPGSLRRGLLVYVHGVSHFLCVFDENHEVSVVAENKGECSLKW